MRSIAGPPALRKRHTRSAATARNRGEEHAKRQCNGAAGHESASVPVLFHDDGSLHSALQMTGNEACVDKTAGAGEAPVEFAARQHSDGQRMPVVVLHVGVLFHRGGVASDVVRRAEDEFMVEQAFVTSIVSGT